MDHGKLAREMRRLAIEAGAAIMQIYRSGDLEIEAKDDESPVTAADRAADALISAGLRAAFPDLPLVTEEQATSHDQSVTTFLIVDPLDGTKEFVKRRGDFTVNIAYIEDGAPSRGIVYAPAKHRLFMTTPEGDAVEEHGDFRSELQGEQEAIHVATPDNDSLRVVASKSHRTPETDDYISRYNVSDVVSAGSSLKFCLVATGEADIYPRLGRTMEWDTAAGDAVLRAAGGKVFDADTLAPLAYGKEGFANPHFIALAEGVELA